MGKRFTIFGNEIYENQINQKREKNTRLFNAKSKIIVLSYSIIISFSTNVRNINIDIINSFYSLTLLNKIYIQVSVSYKLILIIINRSHKAKIDFEFGDVQTLLSFK